MAKKTERYELENKTDSITVTGLDNLAEEFHSYIGEFSDMFFCRSWNNADTAYKYLCGLIQSERSNMERMEEAVPETDYQCIQQFISSSPWSYRNVIDRVAVKADELIGGTGVTALIIDESGFAKKGKTSVGAARQWNGRLGKTDNCQVAVFSVLSSEDSAMLTDVELSLPNGWTEDEERCHRSGVPDSRIEYKPDRSQPLRLYVDRERLASASIMCWLTDYTDIARSFAKCSTMIKSFF